MSKQSLMAVFPIVVVLLPSAQVSHVLLEFLLWYVPRAHSVQFSGPALNEATENVPGRQTEQGGVPKTP